MAARLSDLLGRRLDRSTRRPAGLVYWLHDQPPTPVAFGLALQQLAVQAVYFVIPAAIAGFISHNPADVTRFLSLSILAAAGWQVLQLLTRGPIGAGYPIPGTHTAAMLGAYMLTGHAGGGFGACGAMLFLAGLGACVLTFMMNRLRAVLPNEVAGVVVILIGVALTGLGVQQFGLLPGQTLPGPAAIAILVCSLGVMVGTSLSGTRAARFAVLIGAGVGVLVALALGQAAPGASGVLAASAWFAVPRPWVPDFAGVSLWPMLAFLLALVAMQATAAGSLVMMQRAADADWTRPDSPPLRRGLLANGLALAAAGLIGGAAPGPATAAVGLSIATGTLARRIVWFGAALLVVVALCPKLVALFVLVPPPVKAAMLFYVAGFIMAQGCNLATVRLLDTRRTLIIASGLTAGLVVAIAPHVFLVELPALASPLSFGAVLAFLANLFTLPLVAQRATLNLALARGSGREAGEWFDGLALSWGLKPQTARSVVQALDELVHLLAERGGATLGLAARSAEDRVEITLSWQGERLPERAATAHHEDLFGDREAQERFMLWMATREAQRFSQRSTPQGCEARLVFED